MNDKSELIGKQLTKLEEYSEDGQPILTVGYENKEEIERLEYAYENDLLVSSKSTSSIDGSEMKYEYEYKNGKLYKAREYFNEKDYIETQYEYYAGGKTKSIAKTDNDNEFHGKIEMIYDDENRSFTETEYGEGNVKAKEEIIIKDENGNEIENRTTKYESDGWSKTSIIKKAFDDKNNVLTAEVYEDGKLVFTMENHYYEDSGLLEEKDMVDKVNGGESEIVYYYDDKNREIKRETYNNDALTGIREFVYDDFGNIVQEKVSTMSAVDFYDVDVFEFEIEYFEVAV